MFQLDLGVNQRLGQVEGKLPGHGMELRPIDLHYGDAPDQGSVDSPSAYEHLLLDAVRGDPTFFAHAEMPVYVIAALSKGSRENFSDAEVAAMAKFSKAILASHKARSSG